MSRKTLLLSLALVLGASAFAFEDQVGRAHAAPTSAVPSCSQACRAGYQAIARALPRDRANVVARAIVRTSGFSYPELSRALGVPTGAQIRARWRASCEARFPKNPATVATCDREIVGGPTLGW
jgi:hypothetical protein